MGSVLVGLWVWSWEASELPPPSEVRPGLLPAAGSVPGLAVVGLVQEQEQGEQGARDGVGMVDVHWGLPMAWAP